eukprot:355947-Chlamydomonas_euryale.AAC.6
MAHRTWGSMPAGLTTKVGRKPAWLITKAYDSAADLAHGSVALRPREEFDKLAADHSLQACEAQAGSNDVCPPAEPAAAAASVEMACPASQSAVPDLACAVPRQAWSGAVHGWLPWLAEEVPIPCAFVELHEGVFDVQAAVSAPRFGRYVVVKLLCAKQA